MQAAYRSKQMVATDKDYFGTEPLELVVRDVASEMKASEEDIGVFFNILI